MNKLRDLSIKDKLITIIFLVSLFPILIGFSFIIFNSIENFTQTTIRNTVLNAKLTGEYCAPALDFEIKESAEEVLKKLETIPTIVTAVVYNSKQEVFAVYQRAGQPENIPPQPENETATTVDKYYLHIYQPIIVDGNKIGIIYLKASKEPLIRDIKQHVGLMGILLIGMLILIYFLALKFQVIFSKPILQLAEITNKISKKADYSVRVERKHRDEIGVLYDGFNDMLEKIQLREKEIQAKAQALRESEQKLYDIIDFLPDPVIVLDEDKRVIAWNKSIENMTGVKAENMLGKGNYEYAVPFYGERKPMLIDLVCDKTTEFDARYFKMERNGNRITAETYVPSLGGIYVIGTATTLQDSKGQMIGYIQIIHDITERKKTEEAIEESYSKLEQAHQELKNTQQQLIQSEKMAALGQLIAGVAHEINTPLGAIRSSVGNISTSLDQVLEKLPTFFQSLLPEERDDFFALLQQSLASSTTYTAKEERKIKRTIRQKLESENIVKADNIADTLVDMGIYDNIEPFMPLFVHERGDLILEMAYKLSGLQRSAQNIAMATDRASKVVFALKSYAHYNMSGEKIKADIAEGIETVLTLYYNQLKHGVDVIRNFQESTPILCYPDELNQVWTNLIHNSLQAMEYKGQLTIDVCRRNGDVAVSITDTGRGISEDIREKIFQPFFTTKTTGEGSGLGLDIVKKIIDKHDGRIELESEVGVGTTFTVLLPATEN